MTRLWADVMCDLCGVAEDSDLPRSERRSSAALLGRDQSTDECWSLTGNHGNLTGVELQFSYVRFPHAKSCSKVSFENTHPSIAKIFQAGRNQKTCTSCLFLEEKSGLPTYFLS